jgi:hypothetical protein
MVAHLAERALADDLADDVAADTLNGALAGRYRRVRHLQGRGEIWRRMWGREEEKEGRGEE